MGEKEKVKKKTKEKQGRPTQRSGMGLKALRRGLGVGGSKNNKKESKREKAKEKVFIQEQVYKRKPYYI